MIGISSGDTLCHGERQDHRTSPLSGGRPCVGALAGGSLTPLDPPHHTGGLYFAWLRLNFFRALRAPVFSYIRGLSNVEREV